MTTLHPKDDLSAKNVTMQETEKKTNFWMWQAIATGPVLLYWLSIGHLAGKARQNPHGFPDRLPEHSALGASPF